jgi:hypothetical protein
MTEKSKEGVSVKEIEKFTKKHRLEVFYIVTFVLACLFTVIVWSAFWSVLLATVGAILGVLLPGKVEQCGRKGYMFVFKQEPTTQLILGIVVLILAIFLSPIIFFALGANGGKDMYLRAIELQPTKKD